MGRSERRGSGRGGSEREWEGESRMMRWRERGDILTRSHRMHSRPQ